MIIKEMFTKPITREVKGVVKIGQEKESNVQQELEEYVVTRELQKHFARFFSAYKKGIAGNTDNMGVWISGFFGSGKSHFLKILAYLLENKEVNGKCALDYFIEDHKIEDPMVLADMRLAADTSADVIHIEEDYVCRGISSQLHISHNHWILNFVIFNKIIQSAFPIHFFVL